VTLVTAALDDPPMMQRRFPPPWTALSKPRMKRADRGEYRQADGATHT